MLRFDVTRSLDARRPLYNTRDARHELRVAGCLAVDTPENQERESETEHSAGEHREILIDAEPAAEQCAGDSAADETDERHDPDQERQLQLHSPGELELDGIARVGAETVVSRDDLGIATRPSDVQRASALLGAVTAQSPRRSADARAPTIGVYHDPVAAHQGYECMPPRALGKG